MGGVGECVAMGCTAPGGGAQFWGFPVPTASTTSMQLHFDGEGVGTCLFFFGAPLPPFSDGGTSSRLPIYR